MSIKEQIDTIEQSIKDLVNAKQVTMSLDVYNFEKVKSRREGMALIMNIVFDIINNEGANIKIDDTTSEDISKFIEFVKDNINKGESKDA